LTRASITPDDSNKITFSCDNNPTRGGWYLTGLDGNDLNTIRFTTKVGPGAPGYNNFYAGLSLDADVVTVSSLVRKP
jgi:hypothetical protein